MTVAESPVQRAPLLLSLLAVGLSGWALWSGSTRAPARPDVDLAALEARLSALERVLGERAPEPAPRPASAGEAPAGGAAGRSSPEVAGGPTLAGRARSSATLPEIERRLTDLEKAARERAASSAKEGAAPQTLGEGTIPSVPAPTYYGSVDDAAKDLALTTAQRADFERIVADAKREAHDLHEVPDEAGKTWAQVEKDSFRMEDGVFHFDVTSLSTFREKTVPGRSESFGAADRRIRENARRRLRDALTAEQQAKFDRAQPDGLVGGGDGPFGAVVFSTTGAMFEPGDDPPAMDR